MSPDARRRHSKIVAPQTPNREEELSGGLRNALLRGENINKAKQSFISAGYKPEEVEAASQKIPSTLKNFQQPTPTKFPSEKPQLEPLTTTTKPQKKPRQISKKFLIIMISIAALILVGSALLGIFWDKVF
ncbi:MAG: hypothetical protein V1889_02705 [archaeon]